jgi:hypothetical protein
LVAITCSAVSMRILQKVETKNVALQQWDEV